MLSLATGPSSTARDPEMRATMDGLRRAQESWSKSPLGERLRVIRRARHAIAAYAASWHGDLSMAGRQPHETLAAEVLPLADACRFVEREANTVLAPRGPGRRGRPGWLTGSDAVVTRDPWGVVLVIGASNYPLLIPGVQTVQALAAGNAVLLKPGRGGQPVAHRLAAVLRDAGLPENAIAVLDESEEAGRRAVRAGADKVVLTGSAETGRAVLAELAPMLVPATMELSGNDAVIVANDADLDLAARALAFGLRFNGSATCIAPRRVFVARARASALTERIVAAVGDIAPVPVPEPARTRVEDAIRRATAHGARILTGGPPQDGSMAPTVLADVRTDMDVARSDLFAPVLSILPVADENEAVREAAECEFALGSTVFGAMPGARALAARLDAGIVVINDMIVPTADPRIPFGGRRNSGFGSTRGAEGLLEMTRPKAVIHRRGRFLPHLDPPTGAESALFEAYLRWTHGGSWRDRVRGFRDFVRAIRDSRRARRKPE